MPIKNMWFNYRMECIETFLSRAFQVHDRFTKVLFGGETWEEPEQHVENHADTPLGRVTMERCGPQCDPEELFEPYPEAGAEADHALDMLLGYEGIVLRAVYWELNAVVELELRHLAKSILESREQEPGKLGRGTARSIIEREYGINLSNLPRFDEVDQVREIANAYKHDDGFAGTHEEVFPGWGGLFRYKQARYRLSYDGAYQSIQAVKEFMRALPGDREELPETRYKPEDASTAEARRRTWDRLRRSGALGHDIPEPMPATDGQGGYVATCKLCGRSLRHQFREMIPVIAAEGRCPGALELQNG